jgi:GntR family transcriptional regulator, rspAB operon transcriptional repressor
VDRGAGDDVRLAGTTTRAERQAGRDAPRLLRVDVHERLRDEILTCRLPPGSDLREAELAARFGVSKSPVRDALFRLGQEGLVVTLPRQGWRVTPVSIRDALEMFQLRAILESACVEAAAAAPPERLRGLDRFRRFEPSRHPLGFASYNAAFHRELAELSGNSRLRRAVNDLIDQMQRVVTLGLATLRGQDPRQLVGQHAAIIDALQAGEGRKAARLVRRHVAEAQKRVARALARMQIVS